MQLRTPSPLVHDDGDLTVNLAGPGQHAVIELDACGETQIHVESAADADRLIKAAAEAKRLLSPPGTPADIACPCGHTRIQHIYAGTKPCTQCSCSEFSTPAPESSWT